MVRMSRPALLLCVALLVGGCKKAEGERASAPAASVAGTEAKRSDRSPSSRPLDNNRDGKPATSLIAVATTSASEAQPCERVCGNLGDCLLADDDYSSATAGGLELMCLDMCVHATDDAAAKAEFLACGSQSECGPLQACAERTWTALAEARTAPAIEGVAAPVADPCKLGCRWVYACMYGSKPGDAWVDPQTEQNLNDCFSACEQLPPQDIQYLPKMPACLAHRCSMEGVYLCFEESMSPSP